MKLEKGDYDREEAAALTWALEELTPLDPREELDDVGPGLTDRGGR